jgi:hypothetical protein
MATKQKALKFDRGVEARKQMPEPSHKARKHAKKRSAKGGLAGNRLLVSESSHDSLHGPAKTAVYATVTRHLRSSL